MTTNTNRRPLIAAGSLLGIGLGGFLDGIVFHQMLQTHNMLSAKYPKVGVAAETAVVNIEINMFWDGVFHAATWIITALGLALLWQAMGDRSVPHSTRTLVGSLLFGWGLFNLLEGIVDHHLLHLHHVVEGPNHLAFDVAFLVVSAILLVAGVVMIRSDRPDETRSAAAAVHD